MYFSRVRIASGNNARITLLKVIQGEFYSVHQLVWKLFPNEPEKKRDFLFRQEFEKEQLSFTETRRGMPVFYLVSPIPPKPLEGLLEVETKLYRPKLDVGIKLGFELRANPVIARKTNGKSRSSKHDVLMDAKLQAKKKEMKDISIIESSMEAAAVEWLLRKSEKAGFKADPEAIEVTAYRQNSMRSRGNKEIRFSSIDFAGVLTVKDPILFSDTLFKGLGRSKAFGCGMMMVRRLS